LALTSMETSLRVTFPPDYPAGTVILVSSGVDSTICADDLPEARLLFVDFGQAEVERERAVVQELFAGRDLRFARVDAGLRHTADGVFVPARNLMLACLAIHHGDDVVMGAMADDRSMDKTPEALLAMARILSDQGGRPITVRSPLMEQLKHEAVAGYLARHPLFGEMRMRQTWSCYGPGPERCLNCKACFRWAVAMRVNGIDVPLPADEIIAGYLRRLFIYEPGRQWAILSALRGWPSQGRPQHREVVVVDVDGVLTVETDGRDYARRTPRAFAARSLERLAKEHWVVLHTARPESDRKVTEAWLERHGMAYHGLLMNKPSAGLLVDDLSRTSLEGL